MNYLLDTNACIDYLNRPESSLGKQLRRHRRKEIVVCSVVKAELFFGAMKSKWPEKNLEKQRRFLSAFQSLPFEDESARVYAVIRAELERQGKPIGPHDLQIAAIALANNLCLITHNTSEFARVPRLRLEDWEI